jgi:uncharacterized protein YqiB (DUF1249 family)
VKGRYRIDLPAHMAECDANYLRLMKLAPDLDACDARELVLTIAEQAMLVRIRLVERCPYTSLVELTQATAQGGLLFELPLPRLVIRLYHDTRSAEVVEFQNGRRFDAIYPYPNPEMRQRDEKAQINRFLGEYLSLCLSHGAATEETILVADG